MEEELSAAENLNVSNSIISIRKKISIHQIDTRELSICLEQYLIIIIANTNISRLAQKIRDYDHLSLGVLYMGT